jgi:gamma-glutamyltranspeptidase / glutathione hydrolase
MRQARIPSFLVPLVLAPVLFLSSVRLHAGAQPARARSGMVVSENALASDVGARVLEEGGTAVDAAVATAFALAVTHPTAGNIGGGGFPLYRPAAGEGETFDFRETAPAAASATMFLRDGKYDEQLHHHSHFAVGVPGTVAGLHLAWKAHGKLSWARLVEPAAALARDGFTVTDGLARSLKEAAGHEEIPGFDRAVHARRSSLRGQRPLVQRELAETLRRIADKGPAGFYEGRAAELIEKEMKRGGGLITRADLAAYQPKRRVPLRGSYRGYEVLSIPPPSSGGTALLQMLNTLEGYDLRAKGFGSAATVHLLAEASRRAYADRARYLGDPDFVNGIPVDRLISKDYAAALRRTIREDHASPSAPDRFDWAAEGPQTTHLCVVDRDRNAVSLTYTLEYGYGSKIVVPGAGFLLNNEMGDFNSGPGLTTAEGLIGTEPNLALRGSGCSRA